MIESGLGIIVLYGGDQCICSTSLWLVVMHACVWSCSYNITNPYFKLNSGNNKRHPSPIYSEMYGTGPWFFKKSKYGNLRFRQSGKMGLPSPCRIKPFVLQEKILFWLYNKSFINPWWLFIGQVLLLCIFLHQEWCWGR